MKKKVIIFMLLQVFLYGYQIGDTIDNSVKTKLEMNSKKIYIVDFFASWCKSCKKEMPHLSNFNSSIDKSKIEIIGVDTDEDISKGLAFQKMLKDGGNLNFRVINDPKSKIVKLFNPIGMPALFIIKNNKVVDMIIGATDHIDKVILAKLKRLE